MSLAVPEEGDVLSRHFLQLAERGGLASEKIVWVVVRHDGGGADFAQLILRALKAPPHCVQVVLSVVPHCRKKTRQRHKQACYTKLFIKIKSKL